MSGKNGCAGSRDRGGRRTAKGSGGGGGGAGGGGAPLVGCEAEDVNTVVPPVMNHVTEPPTPDNHLELMDTQEGRPTRAWHVG